MNLKEQCIAFCIEPHKKKRVMKRCIARMLSHKYKVYKEYRDWHGRIDYELYLKEEDRKYKEYMDNIEQALMEDDAWLYAD